MLQTAATMATFTDLPTELALGYMCHLDSPDLFALALTTRMLSDTAISALYISPKIPNHEEPNHNYNRSHCRVLKLTIALLQNPKLARGVTGLDLDQMHYNYEGLFKPLMPRSRHDRSAAEQRLYDLAAENIAPYTEHRDWIWQGNIVGWTYLLFAITPNLETLRLGSGHRIFVEEWWDWIRDCRDTEEQQRERELHDLFSERKIERHWDDIRGVQRYWPRDGGHNSYPLGRQEYEHMLAALPALRSVQHICLGAGTRPPWEWLTLPSMRSYEHSNMLQNDSRFRDRPSTIRALWPEDQISHIRCLRTSMSTMTPEDDNGYPLFDPPFENFPYLRALYIDLITFEDRPSIRGGVVTSLESSFGMFHRTFKRLAALAPILEVLEIRPVEGIQTLGAYGGPPITQLPHFTRLTQLGVPAYILTTECLERMRNPLVMIGATRMLTPDVFPPNLKVLSIFPNGDDDTAPRTYNYRLTCSEAVNKVLRNILDWREYALNLRCIRVDYTKRSVDAVADETRLFTELVLALKEDGIRVEDIERPKTL